MSSTIDAAIASAPCTVCGLRHAPGVACPVVATLPLRNAGRVLAPGTMLAGRFAIEHVIHRSAMSTVYRARDHGHAVAIKHVSAVGLAPDEKAEALRWLSREAGLQSSLHNPHLPELLAAFSEGDDHYVVMPYLAGQTLTEMVTRRGSLPEIEVLQWARDLADVLTYLHGQTPPIVHRDLKPENILILPDGQLVLLDLGAAHPLARHQVGTAGYAAPEQYQGLADERSDLYALGATVHYMLTGYDAEHEAPFQHPPVRHVAPAVSRGTESLVSALLQLAPDRRPRTARHVREWLDAHLAAITTIDDIQRASEQYLESLKTYLATLSCLAATVGIASLVAASNSVGTPWAGHVKTMHIALSLAWVAFSFYGLPTDYARSRKAIVVASQKYPMVQRTLRRIAQALYVPVILGNTWLLGSPRSAVSAVVVAAMLLPTAILAIRWWRADSDARELRRVLEDGGSL